MGVLEVPLLCKGSTLSQCSACVHAAWVLIAYWMGQFIFQRSLPVINECLGLAGGICT